MSGSTVKSSYSSAKGCCICRIKTHKEPFVYSQNYEDYFKICFGVSHKQRKGKLCADCVNEIKKIMNLSEEQRKRLNREGKWRADVVDKYKGIKTPVLNKKKQQIVGCRKRKNYMPEKVIRENITPKENGKNDEQSSSEGINHVR